MKPQQGRYKASENTKIISNINNREEIIQCSECDIGFKSEYHLENHIKGSEHSIKHSGSIARLEGRLISDGY